MNQLSQVDHIRYLDDDTFRIMCSFLGARGMAMLTLTNNNDTSMRIKRLQDLWHPKRLSGWEPVLNNPKFKFGGKRTFEASRGARVHVIERLRLPSIPDFTAFQLTAVEEQQLALVKKLGAVHYENGHSDLSQELINACNEGPTQLSSFLHAKWYNVQNNPFVGNDQEALDYSYPCTNQLKQWLINDEGDNVLQSYVLDGLVRFISVSPIGIPLVVGSRLAKRALIFMAATFGHFSNVIESKDSSQFVLAPHVLIDTYTQYGEDVCFFTIHWHLTGYHLLGFYDYLLNAFNAWHKHIMTLMSSAVKESDKSFQFVTQAVILIKCTRMMQSVVPDLYDTFRANTTFSSQEVTIDLMLRGLSDSSQHIMREQVQNCVEVFQLNSIQ